MQEVVLATGNPGKLRELRELFSGLAFNIKAQSEFNVSEVDETGTTFVENAIIKARHAAAQTGMASIADDSGIEVDALNGAPGIRSARYAGENASDEDNLNKLLEDLKDVPEGRRGARFQCLMVYMRHAEDATPIICQGTWEGSILFTPRGTNGFGYDPIFYVPSQSCSSAELPAELKNRLSHRGQALQKLVHALSVK